MNIAEWIALGTLAALFAGGIWKNGRDTGEFKSGVRELLNRDDRTTKRVDTLEHRLNDHTTRIARLEGTCKANHQQD